MNVLDFSFPFRLDFDLATGISPKPTSKRYLSDLKGVFFDEGARRCAEKEDNKLVYEFHELAAPETAGDIAFGTSVIYPGDIAGEYFMTKGHFHSVFETAEVYICLKGRGVMVQENPEGKTSVLELLPGSAVYCPQRFAHRTVNTGTGPLVVFFAFRADAGHDYGTIEVSGFRKLIMRGGDGMEIRDNPKYRR